MSELVRIGIIGRERALSAREKAAIIVRLMIAEDSPLPLTALPDHVQAALTEQMAQMSLVDRGTLAAVVKEFTDHIEGVGLAFPNGLEGALSVLDGHISPSAASRLRRLAGASGKIDPWERIVPQSTDRLLDWLEQEAAEIGAVLLSKLPVPRAAELLEQLPGEKARRIARAVSLTERIDPETVRRIGLSLAAQIDSTPPRAFDDPPAERVGAILTISSEALRERLLQDLADDDAGFAQNLRRAIFTFAHIPRRIEPKDCAKILREVEQDVLITALAGATGDQAEAADYLLANISQRLAETLREEIAARGAVPAKDGLAAQNAVILALRKLEGQGELRLRPEEGPS